MDSKDPTPLSKIRWNIREDLVCLVGMSTTVQQDADTASGNNHAVQLPQLSANHTGASPRLALRYLSIQPQLLEGEGSV